MNSSLNRIESRSCSLFPASVLSLTKRKIKHRKESSNQEQDRDVFSNQVHKIMQITLCFLFDVQFDGKEAKVIKSTERERERDFLLNFIVFCESCSDDPDVVFDKRVIMSSDRPSLCSLIIPVNSCCSKINGSTFAKFRERKGNKSHFRFFLSRKRYITE
jgi:hypothetical protein